LLSRVDKSTINNIPKVWRSHQDAGD
jgi:hypothetical protein